MAEYTSDKKDKVNLDNIRKNGVSDAETDVLSKAYEDRKSVV